MLQGLVYASGLEFRVYASGFQFRDQDLCFRV